MGPPKFLRIRTAQCRLLPTNRLLKNPWTAPPPPTAALLSMPLATQPASPFPSRRDIGARSFRPLLSQPSPLTFSSLPPPESTPTMTTSRPLLNHIAMAVVATAAAATAPAFSQPQGHPARHAPPPEAYAACKGKTEGDSVTLTLPDGKSLTGTCRTMDGTLVAMPAGRPGGPGGAGGPPPAN